MPKESETSLFQKITLVALGVFLFLTFIEIGLRIGGITLLSLQEHRNIASIRQKDIYRIMCLGESTTVLGFGSNSYPAQLEEILNQHNIGIKFSVINKGVIGISTSTILANLADNFDRYKPQMVVTMMGINDENNYLFGESIVSASKIITFFKNFRIYKLAKLLWLHILTKISEKDKQLCVGLLNKEKELPADNFKRCLYLARVYRSERDYYKGENAYKKAIELNPKNERPYVELGWLYDDHGMYSQAEESLKKAIEIKPRNYRLYLELGWFYRSKEKYFLAEELFRKAMELNPQEEWVYIELGWLYNCQGKYIQSEAVFKKALEITSRKENNFWRFFRNRDKYAQAAYGGLAALYTAIGRNDYAQEYFKKANELRLKYFNPITRYNYQKVKEICDKRGIRLVCVQYPVRSIKPLKKIFEGQKGIMFVDNEEVFKDALKENGYNEYFTDIFAGDFGHCTPKGNRLLAENIAKEIIKECFNK